MASTPFASNAVVSRDLSKFPHDKSSTSTPTDVQTIACMLRKCGDSKDLSAGKCLHDYIFSSHFGQNTFIVNHLVHMYGRCGALQDARRLFEHMGSRRNCFSWNIMLGVYIHHREIHEALKIFEQMPRRDVVSWTSLISAYAHNGQLRQALLLFEKMPKRDIFSWNSMIAACTQEGHVNEALILFNRMPLRNVVSWTLMVVAYARKGNIEEAKCLFENMPERNVVSWTAMVVAYAKAGQLEEALRVFHEMPSKNVVSWNALVASYAQQGYLHDALKLFRDMPCRNVVSWNSIMAAFAQQGLIKQALQCFEQMPRRDLASWTTMITTYAQHGDSKNALQLFAEMQSEGLAPDELSFDSFLLACRHEGLVDKGCHCFLSMSQSHCVTPLLEHYNSMIDLLGRVGWVDEAVALVTNMPLEAGTTAWLAVLAACRTYGFSWMGMHAAEHVLELSPNWDAAYVLLSNIYAAD